MNRWIKALTAALLFGVLAACGGDDDPVPVATTPPVALPAAPSGLSVTPGDQKNTVQWLAVPTADSYTLYWSDKSPLTKATATAIPTTKILIEHTGLTNGKLLYYAVTAKNSAGESELSSVIGATPVAPVPAAPTSVNASAANAAVALAWSPVSGADSYNVYWSKAAGVAPGAAGVTKIDKVAATSYAHTGLTNGDKYYYIVTAVNTGGESVASPEISATPMPPAPGAPANFAATSGNAQVQLTWSPVTDATSYNVYWSKTAGVAPGGAGVTKIPDLKTTSYTQTDLINGDTYYYIVSAIGMAGEGAASAEKSARPLPPPPPAPLGVTAIAPKDAAQVTVQWYDVPNYPSSTAPIQLGYNLYRGLLPGVATYYKDATRATKFANVTAPYIDSTVLTTTTYYYVVTAFVPPAVAVAVAAGKSRRGPSAATCRCR
jgi:fibronectin type 3 domain-containing protein